MVDFFLAGFAIFLLLLWVCFVGVPLHSPRPCPLGEFIAPWVVQMLLMSNFAFASAEFPKSWKLQAFYQLRKLRSRPWNLEAVLRGLHFPRESLSCLPHPPLLTLGQSTSPVGGFLAPPTHRPASHGPPGPRVSSTLQSPLLPLPLHTHIWASQPPALGPISGLSCILKKLELYFIHLSMC